MAVKNINLQVEVNFFKEGDYIIAYAPALDLSAYGDSEEDAKKSFEQSLKLFIKEVVKKGTLEKLLLELGWNLVLRPQPKYTPPAIDFNQTPYAGAQMINSYSESVAIPV